MKALPEDDAELSAELTALLERRAERVRARPAASTEDALVWVAEFPVGEVNCAIPLEALRAAVPLKSVTPVPHSPPHVVGILRYQGQILTALSLASLLGGLGWREDPAVLLVVDSGFGLLALDCERIPKPMGLPRTLVDEARARSGNEPGAEITLPDLRQVLLIDLRRLMDRRNLKEQRDA